MNDQPTAAAVRAARYAHVVTCDFGAIDGVWPEECDACGFSMAESAANIDRETHLPELIAVLKEADNQFRLCGWHSRTHPRAMIRAALALFKEPSDA